MARVRKISSRKNQKAKTGFSLVELMLSLVIISIIAVGLNVALFRTREKTHSYSVDLASNQECQTILRQIARDYRQAELIRFYHLDNKYFIIKNAVSAEMVSYFLDADNSLIKYDNYNNSENYENLLSPVTQLFFETETTIRNEIVYVRGLTVALTIGSGNESETYRHTVSLFNHPIWDEVATSSPIH